MHSYIKQIGMVCLLCWLCLSCTSQRPPHPVLKQIGGMMEERPDSAFSLLKSLTSLSRMRPEDKAAYALLLAEAADKNGYSLLPCDSVLNIALHIYDEDAKEHAIALLYKGKVQQEMENYTEAQKSYRMALQILSAYPQEHYWKGFVYSMLGGLYGKQNLYARAKEMYIQACHNDSLAGHTHHFISSLSNLSVASIGDGDIKSAQQKHNKERIAVLTHAEQRQLREIIGQVYADYIEHLHTQYPKLNEEDILLLCLQMADLSPFAIALCFGNNDAQIVAQRKYRMKSKMET